MALDDEKLMAYLDGELGDFEQRRIEAEVAGDPELQARLDAQRRLRDQLAAHYTPVAQEPVPERFRAMLESNIVHLAATRTRRPWPLWQGLSAIAATLVLGVFVGHSLPDTGPVQIEGGVLVAQGSLEQALDTQLASAQPADAATRIGVSFARADGSLCRTFDSAALAGIACRGDGHWRLVMTTSGSEAPRSEYRQAGTPALLVLEAAQAMMAGEPLDATGERRSRDAGWR